MSCRASGDRGGGEALGGEETGARRTNVVSPRSEIVFDINLVQDDGTGARRLVPYEAGVVVYRRGDFKLMRNTTVDGWYDD